MKTNSKCLKKTIFFALLAFLEFAGKGWSQKPATEAEAVARYAIERVAILQDYLKTITSGKAPEQEKKSAIASALAMFDSLNTPFEVSFLLENENREIRIKVPVIEYLSARLTEFYPSKYDRIILIPRADPKLVSISTETDGYRVAVEMHQSFNGFHGNTRYYGDYTVKNLHVRFRKQKDGSFVVRLESVEVQATYPAEVRP